MSAVDIVATATGVVVALSAMAWRTLGRRIDEASHCGGRSW